MASRTHVAIGDDAIPDLLSYIETAHIQSLVLVADTNTWRVQGQAVEKALLGAGRTVRTVVLAGHDVTADAPYILRVLLACDRTEEAFLAVGSGTITDITRFVSHRSRSRFLSMPTAPSVDGFTSVVAPLVADGVKLSAQAHAPEAIFASLDTLRSAPRAMIAAGLGDMLAKHTSIADWRLGNLLWDLRYDEVIAGRFLKAARSCEELARGMADATPQGVRGLLEALIESGHCMLDFGTSLPASGSEHHMSHYWEMELYRTGRHSILHGAKVGVATVLMAGLWERVRATGKDDLERCLTAARLPPRAAVEEKIRAAYGNAAPQVLALQTRYLDMDAASFQTLKDRILEHWDRIREIAAQVPASARVADLIRSAGGPTTYGEAGLSKEDFEAAYAASYHLRDHFTVRRLASILWP